MRAQVREQVQVQVQHRWEVRRNIEIEEMWAGEQMAEHLEIAKWTVDRPPEELNETCRLEYCTLEQYPDQEELIDLDVRWEDRNLVFAGMRGLGLLNRPFRRCAAYHRSQGFRSQQDD